LFTIFVVHPGTSQDIKDQGLRILFQGIVRDASTFTPVPNSQIMINREFSSVSDNDGFFVFYVYRSDTVVFSSLGYKSTTMLISDTLSGKEFMAGVYMQTDTLAIGDVVIIPRLSNLRSEILNAKNKTPETFNNARYNLAVSAYQGRNSVSSLSSPEDSYAVVIQRQKEDAFSRGGIPSDKILGISPLLLVPAAYMLLKGPPELPAHVKPVFSDYELEQIQKKYLEIKRQRE
jgi:hypothetical protein